MTWRLLGVASVSMSVAVGLGCATGAALDDESAPDASLGPIDNVAALSVVAPLPDRSFVIDGVGSTGHLATIVEFEFDVTGPITEVVLTDSHGKTLGTTKAPFQLTRQFTGVGEHTITAQANDNTGATLATRPISFTVSMPTISSCSDWLTLYGLDWQASAPRRGVEEPVSVAMPLNGVSYRYLYGDDPRQTMFMDCRLALSLARAAAHLRARDVIQVLDVGVYNYRCIRNGDPPNCKLSQHAHAKAIDIAGFVTGDGEVYSVEGDWVINDTNISTCAAVPDNPRDAWLRKLICELKTNNVWNIILTPNYDEAHRDHFHVDLTTDSDFLRSRSSQLDRGPDDH